MRTTRHGFLIGTPHEGAVKPNTHPSNIPFSTGCCFKMETTEVYFQYPQYCGSSIYTCAPTCWVCFTTFLNDRKSLRKRSRSFPNLSRRCGWRATLSLCQEDSPVHGGANHTATLGPRSPAHATATPSAAVKSSSCVMLAKPHPGVCLVCMDKLLTLSQQA